MGGIMIYKYGEVPQPRGGMMNRDDKIDKVARLIPQALGGDFRGLAEEIIDALEEEPEQFFADEVVNETCHTTMCLHRYGDLDKDEQQRCELEKLPTKLLAVTIGARIDGATWWAIDAEGCMTWWEKEPASFKEWSTRTVSVWSTGGEMKGVLKTNIRQEPEKGKL